MGFVVLTRTFELVNTLSRFECDFRWDDDSEGEIGTRGGISCFKRGVKQWERRVERG
jgi:hypothetical protein